MRYSLFLLLLFATLSTIAQRRQYKIGDSAFCGIVFFIQQDSSGQQHGMVAALEDQAAKITWNNGNYIVTNAVKDVLFDKLNANRIIAKLGFDSMYAAIVCAKYFPQQANSFCDTVWYLPSKAELLLVYKNLALGKKSKFAKEGYWTSVEFKAAKRNISKLQKKAWIVDFLDGKTFPVNKANKYHVRAIREFRN
ncbi:MAG: hypothetical protein JWQ09_4985 [Segetibacter sp.]|nr:hypothetical protein [Segetibacter sp.]